MLLGLFEALRAEKVPVTLREWLDLMAALQADLAFADIEQFHALARAVLVKDECHFDRFDRAFGRFWQGVSRLPDEVFAAIPEDWLRREFERVFTDEEKAQIQQQGGLEELMRRYRTPGRTEGATKAAIVGSAVTVPVRSARAATIRAAFAWVRRAEVAWPPKSGNSEYRNLDGDAELSSRFKPCANCGALPAKAQRKNWTCRNHRRHRQGRFTGRETPPRAAQCRESAAVSRHRRLDGRPRGRPRSPVRRGA